MALQALWAPETQFQNKNGSLLVQGKIYVQYRGRSQLAKTYRDAEGTYLNPNPLLTDNDGRVLCFADDAFSYTAVVCDFYGNELFSFDPIPCGSGSGSGSSTGSSAQHWIGINGQTQQISRNTYTRLKLPSGLDNVDYEGDFVLGTIKGSGTEMVLKEGLYLVNTVIRFKQSSDDLTNTLSNVIIHTRDFDTPNIQEVGAVVRDEAGPDASDDIHTITLTYIRHVTQDDVGSDRIKFAVVTPNTWTECYIQNLQIAKLGSSVGGGGGSVEQYYAGQYISIENDTISVCGIEPENYVTHDELQSATSAFITSADLPDLSSYATEQWVLDKHYITSADIPEIPDDLVTSAELAQTSGLIEQDIADLTSAVSEALSDKMDKSSSADFYPRYDNPEGYLTSIPPEFVTDFEMSGYVQDHTSGFITSADLPDVSDMATKTWVTEQHYITSADVPAQIEYSAGDNIDITNHVVSVTDTSLLLAGDNVSITPSGNDYIISAQVPETSGYVTEQEMNDAIQSATSAFITSADIPEIPDDLVTSGELATVSGEIVNQIPSLDGYATEDYVNDYVTEQTSAFITSADLPDYATETYVQEAIDSGTSAFLTSADLPDVSDMATQTWVSEQGYLTSIPDEYVTSGDLSSYVTDTDLESELSGKADTSAIPDVSNFVTQEDIDAAVSGKMDATESSAFYPMATNPSGYLTSADVDMSAYIPYSAAGVDLPNSKFRIDTSGQAYKNTTEDQSLPAEVWRGTIGFPYPTAAVYAGDTIEVRTTVPEAYYIDGIPTSTGRATFVNGVARFTVENSSSFGFMTTVFDADDHRVNSIDTDNTVVVVIKGSYSKYALESYVNSTVSGKQDKLTFEYNEQSAISAINGSAVAGGSSFDPSVLDVYIPYSAAGVDLPNSNFSIDVSGQAYKKVTIPQEVSLTFYSKSFSPQETLTAGTYELTTSATGADEVHCQDPHIWTTLVNGVAKFTLDSSYQSGTVLIQILDEYGDPITGANASNTTLVKITQELTEYLTTSDLSGYATKSYVDSAVSGKQDTLTFGYDESDKINAINGSAIAGGGGGGGYEYSGTNGVYVDNVNEVIGLDTSASNAIETVIENSGAWGGAGLPISAGPGIAISLDNGTLVIGLDTSAVQAMLS